MGQIAALERLAPVQATLFEERSAVHVDPELTGGLNVAVDECFASAERVWLDENSWVDHAHGWLSGDDELMRFLMAKADWEQRSRWMYDRRVQEPRLTAEYPVIAESPHPVPHYLADALTSHYRLPFTRLWMNWYRDNQDSTSWHADRPADQLERAVIPVLSLGATRRFLVKPNVGGRSRVFEVHGGDLIVMGGRCQRDHKHAVPKQKPLTGSRVSLNFSAAHGQPGDA